MERAKILQGKEPTEAEQNHESEKEVPTIIERADLILDGTVDPYANAKKILGIAK